MRSIDRARRDGIRWYGRPDQRTTWDRVNDGTVEMLRKAGAAQVVVADDVANWRYSRLGIDKEPDVTSGYPSPDLIGDVRLPYESMWIEYPSLSGKERRALLISNETGYVLTDALARANGDPLPRDWPKTRAADWYIDAVAEALKDADRNGCERVDHVVTAFAYLDDTKRVYGPVGITVYVLDPSGIVQGTRWLFLAGDHVADVLAADGTQPEEFLQAISDVGLWTIALMNMRNVTTEEVRPPVVRRHRKRGNLPPARYHVLRVKLPGGRLVRLDGSSSAGGDPVGLHQVRGHPAHYGDCCPGAHPPNKALFGKLTGVYWIPAHLRGSKEAGEVLKDYEAVVLSDEVDRD